ncbi:MAG: arsenate reductase (glutaredoxin) [Planctomycetota bacterium]|nr:MAG: arsenate reductase (glutaredoxin) [Planctomycetota bacterium]
MSALVIYHNPKCSKSRETLQLIEEKNVEVEIIEYLSATPTKEKILQLFELLNVEPLEMMRVKESRFAELELSTSDVKTKQEWATILSENPILIERPIVVTEGKAIIGRPPELVLELIKS